MIPLELKIIEQWVTWKLEKKGEGFTKEPYQPNGRRAASTKSDTWSTFSEALAAAPQFDGIGFVFAPPYVGFDADHVINDDGTLEPEAALIVDMLDSYTEISPSGHGLHVICRGDVNLQAFKVKPYEMYSQARFFTVTGNVYDDRSIINDRPEQLQHVHDVYLLGRRQIHKEKSSALKKNKPVDGGQLGGKDNDLTANDYTTKNTGYQAKSCNLSKFGHEDKSDEDYLKIGLAKDIVLKDYYYSSFTPKYFKADGTPDDSSHDQGFMNKLAYWANCNPSLMKDTFLGSPYFQQKDSSHIDKASIRSDYLQRTIDKAIEDCGVTAREKNEAYQAVQAQKRYEEAVADFAGLDDASDYDIPFEDDNSHQKKSSIKGQRRESTNEQKKEYSRRMRTTRTEQWQDSIKQGIDLQARLKELDFLKKYEMSDKGNGELFADVFRNEARFNVTAKQWYVYTGKVWVEDMCGASVSRMAKALTDNILLCVSSLEDETDRKHANSFYLGLGQKKYRDIMIKDSFDKYRFRAEKMDKDIYIFNCQNGTLNLKTFEFKPHSPDDLLSKISNVVYDPNAKSERWVNFINEVMSGDKDKAKFLQKALGYALSGDTSLETCFILYGCTTRNGKSTLVETIAYLMGKEHGYAMNMQPETLAQKQNKDTRQASGDIARLNGCRFLNASEPPKRMVFDTALLKTLLGRDTITARRIFEKEFEFIPVFKLFINTNYLPVINDDTLFTSGRISVISFDKHFPVEEQDKGLKDQFKRQDEISGIFNWCLDGLKLFQSDGLEQPSAISNSTREYREESDKINRFLADCMEKSEESTTLSDAYFRYSIWCDDCGQGTESKTNFKAELKAKGLFVETGTIDKKTCRNILKGYKLRKAESQQVS